MKTLLVTVTLFLCGASWGLKPQENRLWALEFNYLDLGWGERCALLFRDWDGRIVAWRWYDEKLLPEHVAPNRWTMAFSENGKPIRVTVQEVYWSRTPYDVEMKERAKFPEHQRKGLRSN